MSGDSMQRQIELQDGRMLGYAEFGPAEGAPVFYFHGFPGSRLDCLLFDADGASRATQTRFIAADRPGMGLSDNQRRRTILGWPDDVSALADALCIDRFAVLGVSGGGPYAAACAFRIPKRLTAAGIVCGMGPSDAPGMVDGVSWTLPGQPALVRRIVLMLTSMGLRKNPDEFVSRSKETMSAPDRQLLDRPELAKTFIAGLQEAFRSGIGGANHDATLYARPWGFRLHDVAAQVHLWHGGQDVNVPISVGRCVAGAIPGCDARFFEEEGHLTLAHNRINEILNTLSS